MLQVRAQQQDLLLSVQIMAEAVGVMAALLRWGEGKARADAVTANAEGLATGGLVDPLTRLVATRLDAPYIPGVREAGWGRSSRHCGTVVWSAVWA